MKRLRYLLVLAAFLTAMVIGFAGSVGASWSTCHSPLNTNIHELYNPPASWPGTRAAHVTYTYSGTHNGHTDIFIVSDYYTKNGRLDFNWDYYYSKHTNYSHNCV